MTQSKENLIAYTENIECLHVNISNYDYTLAFDMYLCKDCIPLLRIEKQQKKQDYFVNLQVALFFIFKI